MQDLFESTSRYRDLFNEELASHLAPLTPSQCREIQLLPGKEPRDILLAAAAALVDDHDDDDSTSSDGNHSCKTTSIMFQQFHAFCGTQIVWMTPDVFVIAVQHDVYGDVTSDGDHQNKSWHSILHPNVFSIKISSTGQGFSVVALNPSGQHGHDGPAHASAARSSRQQDAVATCDFFVRLLAKSSCSGSHVRLQSYLPHGVTTHPYAYPHQQQAVPQQPPVSAAALEYLLLQQQQQQQASQRTTTTNSPTLDLINFYLSSEHWNALSTVGDSDGDDNDNDNSHYKIRLVHCRTVTHSDLTACTRCLQSDRGPTSLIACDIPVGALAAGLIGNARVQSWLQAETVSTHASTTNINVVNRDMEQLLQAFSQNQGLESIQFASDSMILSSSSASASSNNKNKSKNYFWNLLWDSVQHHPKLTKVIFGGRDSDRLGSEIRDPHSQGTTTTTTQQQQQEAVATAAGNVIGTGIGVVGNAAAAETTAAVTVRTISVSARTNSNSTLSARRKRARTRALAAKIRSNTVLQSIQFAGIVTGNCDRRYSPSSAANHHRYVDLQIWKAAVHPILERNIFRPCIASLRAVIAAGSNTSTGRHDDCLHQKLLLSAVCANSGNPNVLHMILSSAEDVVAATGTKINSSFSNSTSMTESYLGSMPIITCKLNGKIMTRNNKRKAQGNAHMHLDIGPAQ